MKDLVYIPLFGEFLISFATEICPVYIPLFGEFLICFATEICPKVQIIVYVERKLYILN